MNDSSGLQLRVLTAAPTDSFYGVHRPSATMALAVQARPESLAPRKVPTNIRRVTQLPDFTMEFQPSSIEHLGLRLYSTLPPVIAELVSNAYDAEAPKVEVLIPNGQLTTHSEVVVRDYGTGMSPAELQAEFLPIGRNRRGEDSSEVMSKNGKRRVTGRKGLGKLSGLGVADEMEVRSVQNGYAVSLVISYEEIKSWSKTHGATPYKPTVNDTRTGQTTDPDGVEVRLRRLRRTTPIKATEIRKGLAKRLPLIGAGFDVMVNGTSIQPGDRTQREDCALSWDIADLKTKAENLSLTGWIGFLSQSSSTGRGVDIFANGKAVELGSYFNLGTTHAQFARAHLVGEIRADFLDLEEDLASTARTSVVWESALGQRLESWGQAALTESFRLWLEHRHSLREEQVIKAGSFDKWLATRTSSEQKVAKKLVKLLARNEDLEPAGVVPLLEVVKSSVESMAFGTLVDALEEEGSIAGLIRLFDEWRIIEAREHLKLADGRLTVIEQLQRFIAEGALEVKQLQPLLVDNLWLLDPAWSDAMVEATYTRILRDECPEPVSFEDKDRRLDILGVIDSHRLIVVELKRPEVKLSWAHLDQIERYTLWARAQFGSPTSVDAKQVDGLLIVGKMSGDATVVQKLTTLKTQGIRVMTLQELVQRGGEYFRVIERNLKAVAPEYARTRRRQTKAAAKEAEVKAPASTKFDAGENAADDEEQTNAE